MEQLRPSLAAHRVRPDLDWSESEPSARVASASL